jgi:hypothetical protein
MQFTIIARLSTSVKSFLNFFKNFFFFVHIFGFFRIFPKVEANRAQKNFLTFFKKGIAK